jgi:TIGR02594 family protein
MGRHYAHRHHYHHRHLARGSRLERGVAQMQARGLADTNASIATSSASGSMATSGGFGSSNVVAEARRYLGGNPTSRGRLWCARFMNMVLERSGHHGTGSDLARSFASYGQRVSGPQVGAIAVMGRRGGGHVGVVSGIDANGNPIVVSGNNGNRVREAPVSRGRIYAYVLPTN